MSLAIYLRKKDQVRLFTFLVKHLSKDEKKYLEKEHPELLKPVYASCTTYLMRSRTIVEILEKANLNGKQTKRLR